MEYSYLVIDQNDSNKVKLSNTLDDFNALHHLGTAKDCDEGFNLILKVVPDVVLINLDEHSEASFQIACQLHQYLQQMPLFIGMAKSQNYAYNAIKNGFFDYWLLPTNEFEVRKTLLKLQKIKPKTDGPTKICLKTYRDYHYIDTNEILYLKADNNATDFILRNGTTISAFKTLKSFETTLPKNFIRIHQSYILNVKYISRINYGRSTCALKNVSNQLPFSKSYRDRIDELKRLLSKNAIDTLK